MRLNRTTQLCKYELDCVDQAILFIEKNYRNAISAEKLAMEAGLSIRKLRVGLKTKTGLTLHEFHFTVRIEKAKPLLQDTYYPLKAIASSVGFKTESHFCKRFKRRTMLTPIEYRLLTAKVQDINQLEGNIAPGYLADPFEEVVSENEMLVKTSSDQ
jgi:transcriptional regulator GlxA family with amidase domain